MPGVDRDNIDISLENGMLTVEGTIDFGKYEGLQPVYSEYNVGPFRRSFRISRQIDQDKINAETRDGVITLDVSQGGASQAASHRGENRLTRPGTARGDPLGGESDGTDDPQLTGPTATQSPRCHYVTLLNIPVN